MKKTLLLLVSVFFVTTGYSQSDKFWAPVKNTETIIPSKNVERLSFPQEYKLFQLNLDFLRQTLNSSPQRLGSVTTGTIISIPNANGKMERFEMFEASNFEPGLQAQFPDIRSYVGVGIDDKLAQIRISAAPNGIQTMVFRTDKRNEFMEPFSQDGKTYAVYNSSRTKGKLPFTCSTDDVQMVEQNSGKAMDARANNGQLKTFRLAMSCTGEYTTYHGGTVAGALAAINATMTRVNGVFEKDFCVHMNLIANNNTIIYTNAAADPYSDAANMANWNAELQANLTATITEANYDVGHLFGATGGGGNAGCIGCVCVNGSKGSGITSPADGVPMGDTFDIDYVAHELGHQFGGNHTFSFSTENNAVNVEPGSGSTIMGYAGITGATDVQSNSDDYFVYASISQVQTNLLSKTCPVVTNLTTNGAPVMNAGLDWTIPKGTPFILTGTGTDPNSNPITYCWEQNDDATTVSAAASYASPTKTNGPNFRSFDPVSTGVRYMPALSQVLSNTLSTNWESVSTVARTLNFALTGRDNVPNISQTGTDFMTVTVSGTVGPFDVTSQSTTGISWTQGSSQTITWAVGGTTALVGSTNVDILLSTDGGLTFPTTLAANTPNDGTEAITVPNVAAVNCRVMVKPTGNIYYDINTTPFAIGYIVTTTCNTYTNTTPLIVPDGLAANTPGAVASNTINVPTSGTISDVNIGLNVTHTYPNDLVIQINNPGNAVQVPVWNRACAGNDNFNVTLSDGSPAFTCVANMSGTFAPSSALSAFNGTPQLGTWTLLTADYWNTDTGTINSWSINVCNQTATLITEDFGLENFSLYPNPNNGNFNIKFNSSSSNEINVGVHDMRGRQIYTSTFQNTGLIDQNLQLNNVQAGVYLVTVQDGNKKEVKKIVIE
jgi:subtilisin-like proprotein convertase family protein